MSRRGAMWPTELTGHPSFTQLTGLTQRLFQYLWLHPDLNAGGFIAYQPAVWANQAPDLTVDSINASVTEMTRCKVTAADPDTGELLVPSEDVAVDEGESDSTPPPSDFTGIEQRSALCGHCGRYPPMQDGLCGACLGRGVKP